MNARTIATATAVGAAAALIGGHVQAQECLDAVVPPEGTVTLSPGVAEVEFENLSEDLSTLVEVCEWQVNLHPDAGGYLALQRTVSIASSLPARRSRSRRRTVARMLRRRLSPLPGSPSHPALPFPGVEVDLTQSLIDLAVALAHV